MHKRVRWRGRPVDYVRKACAPRPSGVTLPEMILFSRLVTFALVLAAVGSSSACSSTSSDATCASTGTVTVTVTNQDDVENNYVCNATVTLTSTTGGSPVAFTAQGLDGSNVNCIYVANVAPGNYTVSASATGYQPATESVQTTCVTSSPSVMIGLIAIPGFEPDAGSGGGDDAGSAGDGG